MAAETQAARAADLGEALRHLRAGRAAPAERICRQILDDEPDHAAALNLLGVVAFSAGQVDAAIEMLSKAAAASPRAADTHFNLAKALAHRGDLDAAAAAYRTVIAQRPDDATAHRALARVLRNDGAPGEAVDVLRRAARLDPADADIQRDLGEALFAAADMEGAAAAFRQVIERRSDDDAALTKLGFALKELGRFDEALAALRRAQMLTPDSAAAHNNLGVVHRATRDFQAARAAFEAALALEPALVEALNNLGWTLFDLGDLEGALVALQRAIALAPGDRASLINLAAISERANRLEVTGSAVEDGLRHAPDDPSLHLLAAKLERRDGKLDQAIARLEAIERSAIPARVAVTITYELGMLHDRAGLHDRALTYFTEANQASAADPAHRRIEKTAYTAQIDRWNARMSPDWVATWPAVPPLADRPTPVFLVGFPRSGTTLTEQILASHPGVTTIDEQATVDAMIARIPGYPDALPSLDAAAVAMLRGTYFAAVEEAGVRPPPGALLVDKMPLNVIHVGLIRHVFPDARFILVLRHPHDTCLSCFMQNFVVNGAMANFFTIEDAAALYAKAMTLWQTSARILELPHHVLRYEDLVGGFEPEVRRLLDFLGLDWNPAVNDFARVARRQERITTPSYHQVTQEIYGDAVERWRRYAPAFRDCAEVLRPFVKGFGYRA